LGRYLNKTRKRYQEFGDFLDWLAETIDRCEAEALIVAGDIFDNTTPTHLAQGLYYNFLRQIIRNTSCRHVVVVGGNHDSPSFLEAPSRLLKGLGVHVVGARTDDDSQKEVLALHDPKGCLELIVCAVPFLRESDLRLAEFGETDADRHQKIVAGLAEHYREVYRLAQEINEKNSRRVPIVATGHLFFKGSTTSADDGVREIHAGPLSALPVEVLPQFDYLALGHLHTAQRVGKSETMRYSGSPIPMGFNEASQKKIICLVEFDMTEPATKVDLIEVPVFQKLMRLEGDLKSLISQMKNLKGSQAWLEIIHTGTSLTEDYRKQLDQVAQESELEIMTVKDNRYSSLVMSTDEEVQSLNDMSVETIFDRLLEDYKVPEDERPALRQAHALLLSEFDTLDHRAE
jgi:exonuclease SbcD